MQISQEPGQEACKGKHFLYLALSEIDLAAFSLLYSTWTQSWDILLTYKSQIIFPQDRNKLWKILKEMGIPDHLTCLLGNLYAGQEATVRTGHGTTDWFQIGKGVHQGCILSPCLFNLYAEYIMRNTGLEEAQAGIKIVGEISISSDIQMTPPLWQKVKRN